MIGHPNKQTLLLYIFNFSIMKTLNYYIFRFRALKIMIFLSLPCLLVLLISENVEGLSPETILVSGYNSEIARYILEDGEIIRNGSWLVDENMTWMQEANGSIYAIHEVSSYLGQEGGAISRWEMEDNQLMKKELLNLKSGGPAHVLVDTEHDIAITANYAGGSVTVVSLENGHLGRISQVLKFGEGCRGMSHPHHIVQVDDLVWVTDLGCDTIYQFLIDGDQLKRIGETLLPSGSGPRHMVLHPLEPTAFVLCEQKDLVLVYSVNYTSGDLTKVQELELAGLDINYGAEILVSEDGDTMYASSRGKGVVVVYKYTGKEYTRDQVFELEGTWPRSIAVRNNILVAVDQKGDSLQVLSLNKTGLLSSGPILDTPPAPAFVMFLN